MHKSTRNGRRHHSEYDLSTDYQNIKEALAEASADVRGRMGEIFTNSIHNAKTKSSDMQDAIETYVTKKPFKAIGIAMASGLLLGLILRRRK